MKLHHIGIIVKNIQSSLGELSKYLEFEDINVPILVESQKVNVCFLKSFYETLLKRLKKNTKKTFF